jgi:hypothetical protein
MQQNFWKETQLLAAHNLEGLDRIAQRAILLRHRLHSHMPFLQAAGADERMLDCISAAFNAGILLNGANAQRDYPFLREATARIGKVRDDQFNAFVDLPPMIPDSETPLEEMSELLTKLEQAARDLTFGMPKVLIHSQRTHIFYGRAAGDLIANVQAHNVA